MVDSCCAGESRDVTYIVLNLCVSQFLAPSRRNKKVNQKVLNLDAQGRSRFTISSARANNANPVRVLTTVYLYFGKYKQRDCFSWVQHPAVRENMQSNRDCQTLSSSAFVSSPLYGPSCSPSLVDLSPSVSWLRPRCFQLWLPIYSLFCLMFPVGYC